MVGVTAIVVVGAMLAGCAPAGPGVRAAVPSAAFGLRFQVSASPSGSARGWGARIRVEIHNPGDAAQLVPSAPIVLSGVFGQLRADGSFEERGGGFAESPDAQPGSFAVPAGGTAVVERVFPETPADGLLRPGEALRLTVAIRRPLGSDAKPRPHDLAQVLLDVPASPAPARVQVSQPREPLESPRVTP